MNHLDLIRDACDGQQWSEVHPLVQDEILAQYIRDEGFDVLVAGVPEARSHHVFTELLAELVERRNKPLADFSTAGRAFAAAAYSLARTEAEFAVEILWQEACDDYWSEHPDADAQYLLAIDGRDRLEGVR
jgi:hypothetical protein